MENIIKMYEVLGIKGWVVGEEIDETETKAILHNPVILLMIAGKPDPRLSPEEQMKHSRPKLQFMSFPFKITDIRLNYLWSSEIKDEEMKKEYNNFTHPTGLKLIKPAT